MESLTRPSPAKLNLTLRVGGTRADGFHDLESLVVQVDLCDTVTVTKRTDRRLLVECDDPSIPCDHSNLALRAAEALAEYAHVRQGVRISLAKRIPAGAGLGGGSSNAATTLKLLNALWKLGLSHPELAEIGATLGSDVPLFCYGPLSVLRGRGELVEELVQPLDAWAVLVLPTIHCATPAVYAAWDEMEAHADRSGLDDALAQIHKPSQMMDLLFNDLEEPAFVVAPALRVVAKRVTVVTGQAVRLTGSGSALFRLHDTEQEARAFAAVVAEQANLHTEVARTMST